MKNVKKFAALMLAAVTATSCLTGCGAGDSESSESGVSSSATDNGSTGTGTGLDITDTLEATELTFAEGTKLVLACGYNSTKTGITFDAETAGEGIQLADGNTYYTNDLKPTWVELQNRLGMTFESVYTGLSASKEFAYWKDKLDQVDLVSGTASDLSEYGASGYLINLADYLDKMPNFKAYLDKNDIVRLSITGSTTGDTKGAIYFSPYFDGVDDIERMPLMRTDWAEALLNGEGEFTAAESGKTSAPVYQPYMPTSGKVEVEVAKADGSAVEKVTKDYDKAGNIVANMNKAGSMSGVEAVNMLRKYIDEAYNGYYGTNRADLFIGQNAAWDADELVALLRCVVSNAQTLNGTDTVQGLFSREDGNNQRRVDMFRFAGTLFGVRGLESRQDYLFLGTDGKLHDARSEADTFEAMERMYAMTQEGLVAESFVQNNADVKSSVMLEKDAGFMSYDYNQTQTIMNETKLQDGEKYMAILVPVARWFDGSDANGTYMRFTESWRSVKTDGWALSKAGIGDNTDKLNAALKLIDYAYSADGMILMSYGPDAFIKKDASGNYVTFNFNGTQMPEIAEATEKELWEKASGNYTNYARNYLGSTLSFVKSQAFEYQCTHAVGKEGAGKISTAIGLGLIKHPQLAVTENAWYTSIPTVLPNTTVENEALKKLTDLNEGFSSTKDGKNLLCTIIASGFSGEGTASATEAVETVKNTYGGTTYLAYKSQAWKRLLDFFQGK